MAVAPPLAAAVSVPPAQSPPAPGLPLPRTRRAGGTHRIPGGRLRSARQSLPFSSQHAGRDQHFCHVPEGRPPPWGPQGHAHPAAQASFHCPSTAGSTSSVRQGTRSRAHELGSSTAGAAPLGACRASPPAHSSQRAGRWTRGGLDEGTAFRRKGKEDTASRSATEQRQAPGGRKGDQIYFRTAWSAGHPGCCRPACQTHPWSDHKADVTS